MPSLGVLNALLNCIMILTYAVAALAIERAYVHAATLHLAVHGATATTNSAEVHVSHWVSRFVAQVRRRLRRVGVADGLDSSSDGGGKDLLPLRAAASSNRQGSAAAADSAAGDVNGSASAGTSVAARTFGHLDSLAVRPLWSLALLLLLIVLLPAELYFETGLGEDLKGSTMSVVRHNGICASPWTGHSSVGVSAAALLSQRLNWLDPVWTAVPEGASKDMIIAERFAWPTGWRPKGKSKGAPPGSGAIVAATCSITIGTCMDGGCGNLVITRTNGPFHTIATGASMAGVTNGTFPAATDPTGRFSMGDLTYDGATGVAYLFWEGSPPPEEAAAATAALGRRTARVYVRALEVVLNEAEVNRVFDPDPAPWTLDAVARRARTYAVALSTDGLRAADVVMAASIYRTGQMEQPGVRRTNVHSQIERLPPMTPSDVLKAVLALKAEDGKSTCAGTVEEYLPRGTFRLVTALPFAVGVAVVLGVWAALAAATRGLADLHVPHDADSWRSLALAAHGWRASAQSDVKGWEDALPMATKVQWGDAVAGGSGLTPAGAPPPCPPLSALEGCAEEASPAVSPPSGGTDRRAGQPAVAAYQSATPSSVGEESASRAPWMGAHPWPPSPLASEAAAAASTGLGQTSGWRVQVAPPGAAVAAGVVILSPSATAATPPAASPWQWRTPGWPGFLRGSGRQG